MRVELIMLRSRKVCVYELNYGPLSLDLSGSMAIISIDL